MKLSYLIQSTALITTMFLTACGGGDSSQATSQTNSLSQTNSQTSNQSNTQTTGDLSTQPQERAGIFTVQQDSTTVVMDGAIGSSSLTNFEKLLEKYPNISTINIKNCDGSTDDETNLKLSKLVFDKKINIHIMDNGTIASGGTDFFLAGMNRTKGKNTRIGVHSWAGDNQVATDFPRGHANHQPYISYYESVGMTRQQAEDFYYFTIDSAPADSIHWMTDAEISKYNLLTTSLVTTVVTPRNIERTFPASLGSLYTKANNFDRYIKYTAPNGKPIHIVAQDKLSDEQILRSYNVLKHYLTDYAGSKYGANKSAVANAIANNNAILVLLNGQDDGKNPMAERATGQTLFQNEIQVEGHPWYTAQNYQHRDATYEEILHFVHDNGIGVDETNGTPSNYGALPEYQKDIRTAQKNGLSKKLWGNGNPDSADWIRELTAENSLSQEYLASVVDSYYGLWGAWTQSNTHAMWGEYVGKTREDMQTDDPMGYALMDNQFFHPYVTYNARIDASFNGNFSLKFDTSKPYTHHSRYLKDITLLGSNDNSVTVNELDNDITGNSGTNTVIFSGKQSEYGIMSTKEEGSNNATATVTDKVANRDGRNTLNNVQKLQFSDGIMDL